MKKIIALILTVTFLLEQPLSAGCSYINCLSAAWDLTCKCGTNCFGDVWYRGFYQWCVTGSGAYTICENQPMEVGYSAPCVREYNWAAIANCAGAAGGSIPACRKCVLSKGTDKDACQTCTAQLLQIPNACDFCLLVTCEVGEKIRDVRSALSVFKTGEGCHGGPSMCDP